LWQWSTCGSYVAKDPKALDRILDDASVCVASDGKLLTKAEVMADVTTSTALQILTESMVVADVFFPLMLLIRPATLDDVMLLRTLIRELAEFEHVLDLVTIEEADLARDGFAVSPKFRALIAEWDGQPAGYALFFGYYSTWAGPGLYLEDLFVRLQFRGKGIGMALLASVARIALQENCCAMRWEVLEWNEKAMALYKSLGAEFHTQWQSVVLTDDALRGLAEKTR
jgi:GNAT superfamily N-acetyltransferase